MKAKAVFLDRDGTLNPDPGYINDPEIFHLFPGVGESLRRLKEAGFLLVLVTNQSGVGRKLITPRNLCLIHDKLQRELWNSGVALDRIYICPHHPEERCDCRKPLPGLALKGIRDLNIDPKKSFLIGDRESDAKMAIGAGIVPLVIGPAPLAQMPDIPVFSSLDLAVDFILHP